MSLLEKVSNLAKRRGFVYPSSEIYGGIQGMWDYGPLGVLLKRNIKEEFWKSMVQEREDVVGIDASIIMNPKVWEASGHTEAFTDPLVDCKKCKKRFRADHVEGKKCPDCKGELTKARKFNLLVETSLGSIEGEKQTAYLRGEITQGVHANFRQVLDSTRVKIPFGIAQIGKAFRNEITPGQFTFRSREFEQMELQYYIKSVEAEGKKWFAYWKKERMDWYEELGMNKKNLRFREHEKDERAHYARDAWDIEYKLDGEWKEFEGIHHRGDWDLSRHQKFSGEDMSYLDDKTNKKFVPWIIETSGGVDRAALFFLADSYVEEKVKDETRTVLKLHPKLAPYKAAVFSLLANKPKLVKFARSIYDDLRGEFMVAWDERGNIGKRYRAQDEAGTPYCITIDFDSLEKGDVTVRDRDSMKQGRVKVKKLKEYLTGKLNQ
ncbi:glycine--tRNA ligase [bacterium]|nr:glycine--tRNA ligase [bacterium]|tara:strand:+ start:8744 stop:10048 length:1305 start_codon:yes stop_codon:yes gene_type:complete